MKRVILTSVPGVSLKRGGKDIADVVIPFTFRFVWGQLPSPDKLASYPRWPVSKMSCVHSRLKITGIVTLRTFEAGSR